MYCKSWAQAQTPERRRHSGRAVFALSACGTASLLASPSHAAQHNLRFARKTAQHDAPDLAWYEVVSTWLPVNWWAWIAGLSFWAAIGLVTLPGVFRLPKSTWHQAVAALCLTIFLLSVPAHYGSLTRSRLGFVLRKDTPLLLTPTREAQVVTRLAAGEPARVKRVRGNYLLLRTNRTLAWIERDRFGLICGKVAGGV